MYFAAEFAHYMTAWFMVELVHISNRPIFCITTITWNYHRLRGRSSGLILKTISIEISTLQYDHEIK